MSRRSRASRPARYCIAWSRSKGRLTGRVGIFALSVTVLGSPDLEKVARSCRVRRPLVGRGENAETLQVEPAERADAEPGPLDELVDPAIHVATAGDPAPDRVDALLPGA